MKKVYHHTFLRSFYSKIKKPAFGLFKKSFFPIILFFLFLFPLYTIGQALIFSYGYQNITRSNGGGNLETGDTIEVHALVKVDKAANNFYYIDTIRSGTEFINGSLKVVTNEGLLFRGPYTDASADDLGVYDISTGVPQVRVNLGVGAGNPSGGVNFGITTGGGKITPGDKPKFYGTTLLMVAYRLKITANFDDIIHLTGNYYFDTSGINRSYRFNYAGIKIIKNTGFCTNYSSASFTADSSFKSGNVQNRVLAAVAPGYIKINLGPNSPNDNYYAIANNTSADGTTDNTGPYKPASNSHRVFGGYWDIIGDHTGAADPSLGNAPVPPGTNGGYMLVVNAAYPTGEAYRETIKNLCPDTYYEFSAWVRNICSVCGIDSNSVPSYTPGVLPNLSFAVNDIDYYTTGNLPYTGKWVKRGFLYKTGLNETQFTLSIKNNAAGGGGNDWVLDDIKLSNCYPDLIMNPHDTIFGCAGFPLLVTDTVKSFFNSYVYYMWEASLDNGNSWIPLPSTINKATPVLQNGYWVYHVDTVFTPAAVDSGRFIRLKVATSLTNLSQPNCSVNQSQSIFLKIYSQGCSILETEFKNFTGAISGNKSLLQWEVQNEDQIEKFEIEKSIDGIHFQSIGQVIASDFFSRGKYIFIDPVLFADLSYYRIRIINKKTQVATYSKIIVLYNKQNSLKVTVVNPFANNIHINVSLPADGNVEFNLYDIYGNLVNRKNIQLKKGSSSVIVNPPSNLSEGIYILSTNYNGVIIRNKLIRSNYFF